MLTPGEKLSTFESVAQGMRIYGLTGGTGSGKSEVGRVFLERGIPVINADQIGHELLDPSGGAAAAVLAAFGDGIATEGAIDRMKLGALVFRDAEARALLNAIVHPLIREEILRRCRSLARDGHRLVVIDAALLAEDGARDPFLDGLIVVHSRSETRVARLMNERKLTRGQALERIAAQAPPERKMAVADWIVENEGSVEELRQKAAELAEELKRRAGVQP